MNDPFYGLESNEARQRRMNALVAHSLQELTTSISGLAELCTIQSQRLTDLEEAQADVLLRLDRLERGL